MDGRPDRRNKPPPTNSPGVVWTGPDGARICVPYKYENWLKQTRQHAATNQGKMLFHRPIRS